jgi:putative ABC transport system permease protein
LVGVVKEFDVPKIYLDKNQYDALVNPGHLINSLMFVAKDKDFDSIIALKKEIEKALAPTELDVLYVMSQAERSKIIYDHLNIILTLLAFLAMLVLVVSALGMASATGINIMERTREIGVLRAIGATPKMIYGLFVAEGMVVSIVSILLGLLLAWPLSIAASVFFGNLMLGNGGALRFAFSITGLVITLAVTLAFGWLASRVPARKAISVSTREALSYE